MMSMMMNMAAVTTITLFLLCCSVFATKDSPGKCDSYAATNEDFVVQLNYTLKISQRLKWKHNQSVIFDRDGKNFYAGKKDDVDKVGSLKLKNVQKNREGTYTPEVFNNDQAIQNLKSIKLCVRDRLPTPKVKIDCVSSQVKFTCTVGGQAKDFTMVWLQNNKVIRGKNHTQLLLNPKLVEKDEFICSVSNPISLVSSKPVTQTCFESGFVFPEEIWGINTWILVGLGGGVVLLLIVVIIICCIRNRRKKTMQIKDEEELRLGWTTNAPQSPHQYSHPPPSQHRHHHHYQQQPAGHTGPRQHRPRQQRNQPLPRTPDQPNGQPQPSPRRPAQGPRPAENLDDEQPPPLPQPRKKAPKTPRA